MIGKKKPTVQERALLEMQRRGLDTKGVTVVRHWYGFEYWIVKDESVIGTCLASPHGLKITMTEDVLNHHK